MKLIRKKEVEAEQSKLGRNKPTPIQRLNRLFRRNPKNQNEGRNEIADDEKSIDDLGREEIKCIEEARSYDSMWKREKNQRRAVYRQFGDDAKEVIEMEDVDCIPEPQSATDVVIKISASSVSIDDCILRRGMCFQLFDPVALPSTPGFDAIGKIVSRGADVKDWEIGDCVAALIRTGGNARYAVIPASSLVRVPRSVDPAEAACMVSNFMTAYQALQMVAPTNEEKSLSGKKVLVTGGISPTGQALIQLAIRAGASKVFTTAPVMYHKYIKGALGAQALPQEPEEWLPLVEGKMDVVFDGECHDGFVSPQKALTDQGTLVCLGMHALLTSEGMGVLGAPLSAFWASTKATYLMSKTKSYDLWSSFTTNPDVYKTDLQQLFNMLKRKEIKPVISKRISLADIADAHSYIEKGKARGAIVCLPWRRGRGNMHDRESKKQPPNGTSSPRPLDTKERSKIRPGAEEVRE